MDKVEVSEDQLLPESKGLRSPFGCLNRPVMESAGELWVRLSFAGNQADSTYLTESNSIGFSGKSVDTKKIG